MIKKILLSFLFVLFVSAGFALANKVNPTVQDEIKYYEKLKNCIPSKISSTSLMFQTYGKQGKMCSFDMKEKDPVTNKFISNCRVLAPIDETKAFADKKIEFATRMSKYQENKNKPDDKALSGEMEYILGYLKYAIDFSKKYCQ